MALTEDQKKIVLSDWQIVENNKIEVGQHIFLVLFKKHPGYMQLFSNLDGMKYEDLEGSPAMKAHGSNVVGLMGQYMDCLAKGDTSVLDYLLRGTAWRHRKHKVTKEQFIALRDEVLPQVMKDKLPVFDEKHADAWVAVLKVVFDIIIKHLKDAN